MFIPRHPVIEDQFCSYATQSGTAAEGVGGVIAYAGTVVYLDPNAVNEESMVSKMVFSSPAHTPFGFLMQKVKTGYHQVHPAGYYMPGDLGSSDAIAQPWYNATGTIIGTKAVPTGVAHLGIWDTVHYTTTMVDSAPTVKMSPGLPLYAANDQGKVTNNVTIANDATDLTTGENVNDSVVVARVVKGASLAKCTANIANTTLYPIRIKLCGC
jgi:hypothetical protein